MPQAAATNRIAGAADGQGAGQACVADPRQVGAAWPADVSVPARKAAQNAMAGQQGVETVSAPRPQGRAGGWLGHGDVSLRDAVSVAAVGGIVCPDGRLCCVGNQAGLALQAAGCTIEAKAHRNCWSSPLPDPRKVREVFNRAAADYDRHAALEQEVCRRLLERCDFHRQLPRRVLDLGCGTGEGSQALKRRFRQAQVIGLDFAPAMLARMRRRSSLLRPLRAVCADIASLPFAEQSMDLLFSNLASHWSPDPAALFDEFRRVLRPGGMLLFTMLGPATLAELREAWAGNGAGSLPPALPDLMGVGDALLAAGFREPVMDMERITLHYADLGELARELECTGSSLLVPGWERWKEEQVRIEEALAPFLIDGRFPATYEIVYGTAFGPPEGQPRRSRDGDVATFSVDSLLKSRRMG
jgi:malonyl-CoA O-methyltransferase